MKKYAKFFHHRLKRSLAMKNPTMKNNKNRPLVNYVSDEKLRNIVARVSRGNVNLQRGVFLTSEQIKKNRERVAKYDFSRF